VTTENVTALTTSRKDFPQYSSTAWAVYDGERATYLQVGTRDQMFFGVFSCTKADGGGEYTDDCPWLGYCETDAYVNGIGRDLHAKARAAAFDDETVFALLAELHTTAGAR
jgi:hypothetical protein